jgi:hypothetical protein
MNYDEIVRTVIYGKDGLQSGVESTVLDPLVASPAATVCCEHLLKHNPRDRDHIDPIRERRRAAKLIMTLTAMQLDSEESIVEALRLFGARGVEARGLSPAQRLRRAGEARRRPVHGERYYVRAGYAAEMQRRLAQELHELVTDHAHLRRALAQCGDEAIARYL